MMSDDKIAKLHLVVQDPLRQKILLQLANRKMTLNDLMINLEVHKQ